MISVLTKNKLFCVSATKAFQPPEKAERFLERPGEGWRCVGAEIAAQWRRDQNLNLSALVGPREWGVHSSQISLWLHSKKMPTPPQREQIERHTKGAVPAECWLWWLPPEGRPTISEAAIPSTETLGDTLSEMRSSAGRVKALLSNTSLQAKQRAELEVKLLSALSRIAAREAATALEDHPDFEGFLEQILTALEATFERRGLSPQGLRSVFAEELERAETRAKSLAEAA